jgi:anti-sigma regulatory factor (Ser/Thr protein kinase)
MPCLISEPTAQAPSFEFHATLTQLDGGLNTLHASVQLLRQRIGRSTTDLPLMQFELALSEIGANVLRYAHPSGSSEPKTEFELKLDSETVTAVFKDWGPPLHNQLTPAMPAPSSEAGRGLAIARKVLDELGYQREGEVNTWRLVKRL